MMILNTLLSLSLVLLSVVKTADLFIKSDHQLESLEQDFIKKTQGLHQELHKSQNKSNEQGSVSLTAAVLVAILSALLLFYVTKMKIDYKEAVYRKESYLCFHYLNVTTEKYIKEMAVFNWALQAAFLTKASGVATAEAEVAFKALTFTRDFRHLIYIKKLITNKYCHAPETFSYLKNTPFKVTLQRTLETNIDQTTIMRQPKWSYTYFKNPNGIRLKKSFCLKSQFQMQDVYLPNLKVLTQEITMTDSSNLKCFSGASLSPSS